MDSRVRDMREDRDLTQTDIADYLFCDRSLYSRYECGLREIPMRYMVMLAEFYGTSIDYLAGKTDVREPYPPAK